MSKIVRSARLLFEHVCVCGGHSCPRSLILLVLGRDSHGNERWTLPGGRAKEGEAPPETVSRELWEETGHKIKDREFGRSPASFFWWRQSERKEALRVDYTFYKKRQIWCDHIPGYAPLPSEDDEIRAELVPLCEVISGTAPIHMKKRHREKLERAREFFSHAEPSRDEEIQTVLQIPEFVFPMV